MINAWRLVKAEHAADAFSGEGAAKYAGRWHSEGTRVVYTSDTAALAALEILVHIRRRSRVPNFVLIACYFHEALVEDLDVSQLPDDWSAAAAPTALRKFGDQWVRSRASAVLKVPSAVIPMDFNYILNPEHPDFQSIEYGEPRPFHLDVRLVT